MSNDTQVMTLPEFLLARIAEDEKVARSATAGPWERDSGWSVAAPPPEDGWLGPFVVVETKTRNDAIHAANWDPARVLAECEAKRRIVGLHNPCDDWSYGDPSTCSELVALAAVYADHPDYREEWKP